MCMCGTLIFGAGSPKRQWMRHPRDSSNDYWKRGCIFLPFSRLNINERGQCKIVTCKCRMLKKALLTMERWFSVWKNKKILKKWR